jgi:hypothetical protein
VTVIGRSYWVRIQPHQRRAETAYRELAQLGLRAVPTLLMNLAARAENIFTRTGATSCCHHRPLASPAAILYHQIEFRQRGIRLQLREPDASEKQND